MNEIDAVLAYLHNYWRALQSERLADILRSTYQIVPAAKPDFEYMLAGQAASGNMETSELGSQIHQWWRIDNTGCHAHRLLQLPQEDESSMFWKHPIVRFFLSDERVLLGGRLGENLICRKQGTLLNTDLEKLTLINPTVTWASTW